MPASWKAVRAARTEGSPIQHASSRCSWPGAGLTSGSSAAAMSALGTMAVGACMNSTVPVLASESSVFRAET